MFEFHITNIYTLFTFSVRGQSFCFKKVEYELNHTQSQGHRIGRNPLSKQISVIVAELIAQLIQKIQHES